MTILPTGLSRLAYQESDVYKRTRTQHAHLRSNSFFDGTVVNTPAVFASLLRQQMYTTFNHTSATKALLLSACRSTAGIFECYDDNSIDEDHEMDGQSGSSQTKGCVGQRPVLVVRKGGMPLLPSTVPCRVVVDPFGAPSDTPLKMVFCAISRAHFYCKLDRLRRSSLPFFCEGEAIFARIARCALYL